MALAEAEAAGWIVHLEVVLPSDRADALLRLGTDQRAVVQRPRDGGLRDARKPGDVGDRVDSDTGHCNRLHCTDKTLRRRPWLVEEHRLLDRPALGECAVDRIDDRAQGGGHDARMDADSPDAIAVDIRL